MIPKRRLFKISVNYYLRHKIQSVLLVLGIALGVAVIVAIDIANLSARKSFDKSLRSINSGSTHSIYGANALFDEELYFHLRKELGYKNIVPIIERSAYIEQFPNEQFKIIGIDPFSESSQLDFLKTNNIALNSKSFELFLTGTNSAIISNKLLARLRLQIGETFVIITDRKREVKIAGTIDTAKNSSLSYSSN
nr:hypothetical protein [Candidatus Dadabacteria bacterium]